MDAKGLRVLVVEDDALVAMGVVLMLEELGHEPIEATTALQALALLRDGLSVDVVISDHKMPGMTGTQLALELRTLAPDLPFILATGFAEIPEALRASGLRVLDKPFGRRELSAALEAVVPSAGR